MCSVNPKSLANPTASWYQHPSTVVGSTITYAVTDGGAGDSDRLAIGSIVDPAGPAIAVVSVAPALPVPALKDWALVLLSLLLAGAGWMRVRRLR